MVENSKIEALLEQSIQAQNRTTRAVRAFVRFLFIQLSATTLAVAIYSVSSLSVNPARCAVYGENCQPNTFGLFIALLIWIIGVVWSSSAGWSELSQSDLPPAQRALHSSPSEGRQAAAGVAADANMSQDDWQNAWSMLTYKELKAWENAGSPSLAKWVSLDKPNFIDWLQNGPH